MDKLLDERNRDMFNVRCVQDNRSNVARASEVKSAFASQEALANVATKIVLLASTPRRGASERDVHSSLTIHISKTELRMAMSWLKLPWFRDVMDVDFQTARRAAIFRRHNSSKVTLK